MIKKKYLFLLLLIFSSLQAQNRALFSVNLGRSLYNSENSMKTIGDKRIDWFGGLSIAFEKDSVLGFDVRLEYNYNLAVVRDVLMYSIAAPVPTDPPDLAGIDLNFAVHNFDLGICYKANDRITLTAGPSVAFVERSIVFPLPESYEENRSGDFNDRLVSLCAGLNASANLEIPFNDNPKYLFFYGSLKYRFLRSIWFDARGRKLANYSQSFGTSQLNIGLGYNF